MDTNSFLTKESKRGVCVCVYICVYVCIWEWVYVRVCERVYESMYVYESECIWLCVWEYVCVCESVYESMCICVHCVYMRVWVWEWVYENMCVYVFIFPIPYFKPQEFLALFCAHVLINLKQTWATKQVSPPTASSPPSPTNHSEFSQISMQKEPAFLGCLKLIFLCRDHTGSGRKVASFSIRKSWMKRWRLSHPRLHTDIIHLSHLWYD